jgi:preprotein translocase subunit SecA
LRPAREPALAEAESAPARRSAGPVRDQARRRGNGYADEADGVAVAAATAPRAPWAGTGRNAPCPCGSGKKYKHCHGRL